jgi:hypothetical protein
LLWDRERARADQQPPLREGQPAQQQPSAARSGPRPPTPLQPPRNGPIQQRPRPANAPSQRGPRPGGPNGPARRGPPGRPAGPGGQRNRGPRPGNPS